MRRCGSLREVNVSDENEDFYVEDNVLFSKDKTILYFYFSKEDKEEYKMPDTVKTIKSSAFHNSCLKSIIISQSVSTIEDNAFLNCLSLETISIPKSVKDYRW